MHKDPLEKVAWSEMIRVRTSVEKVAENSGTEKDTPEWVFGMGLKEGVEVVV